MAKRGRAPRGYSGPQSRGYNSYNATSSAYKLDTEYVQPPHYPVEPQYNYYNNAAVLERKRGKELRRAEKRAARAAIRTEAFDFSIIAMFAVLFAGTILMMVSSAKVTEKRVELSKMEAEITSLQNENSALLSEIADDVNLEYIREQAQTRLGMAEPKSHQIIYIEVPKESYTVQNDSGAANKENSLVSGIINFFKKD